MKLELGEFNVESGKVVVSDPCYDLDTICMKVLENVKKGKWFAEVEMKNEGGWGNRVAILRCFHESLKGRTGYAGYVETEIASDDIGVDSGQAGIFDVGHFKKDVDAIDYKRQYKGDPICENEPWYSMCCDVTMGMNAGVIPFGVVSSSGFGDGCYVCEVGKKDDEIALIEIDFGLNKPDEREEEDSFFRGERDEEEEDDL